MKLGDWTRDEIGELELRYPHETAAAIAKDLDRPRHSIYAMASKLGLSKSAAFNASPASGRKFNGNPKYRRWTADEDQLMRRRYPDERAIVIAEELGRAVSAVHKRARLLGIEKSEEFWASVESGRIEPGDPREVGKSGRFPKGHVPSNKGLRRPGWSKGRGRMQETQFKPGDRAHNYKPIGSVVRRSDGYWVRKVQDHGRQVDRWRTVHALLWEAHNGPIPDGYLVTIRGGVPDDPDEITIDKLSLISKADNARRNAFHRYPQPIKDAIRAKSSLTRAINRKQGKTRSDKGKRNRREHDLGSPDAPIRDDQGSP